MKYKEIFNEYVSLIQEKTESQNALSSLKDGYISIKTISGKKYAYLQHRVDGKLISEYIHEENLPLVQNELNLRSNFIDKLRMIDARLMRLENAAKILDESLYREMITLRRCAEVDSMPIKERQKSLAFACAMTALEGIPVSWETENNLTQWVRGECSFQESFKTALRRYHLSEI